MKPATVTLGRKGVYTIIHECLKCGKIIPNRAAENDDIEKLIGLINKNPELAGKIHIARKDIARKVTP